MIMNARAINFQDQARHQHGSPVSSTTGAVPRRFNLVTSVSGGRQNPSVRSLRALAQEKAQHGDRNGAIAILTTLIELNPTSAADYNNRGLIYFQNGQKEQAIADYNTALELDPHLDSVYNNRANYYASLGQLAEAIADYEMTLDLNPGNVRAWINQGITFRDLGLYDLALENFDLVLGLGQLQGNIYAERGRTNHLRGDWNCAIADYRNALAVLAPFGSAGRLRDRVENWMNQLLKPISA
jgi:tetratricopeptide (TPR) repeat protein